MENSKEIEKELLVLSQVGLNESEAKTRARPIQKELQNFYIGVGLREVEGCLLGTKYPVSQRELIAIALNNRCGFDVFHAFEHLRRRQYENEVDVERAIIFSN